MLLETNELYLNHPKTLKFNESRYTHCAMRLVFIGKFYVPIAQEISRYVIIPNARF